MNSQAFGAFLDIESARVAGLDPVLPKSSVAAAVHTPPSLELDELSLRVQYDDLAVATSHLGEVPFSADSMVYEADTPVPLTDPSSRPSSPRHHEVNIIQSWSDPPINKWRILGCCLVYFVNGMNDSAPGALLPYMEQYYEIGYAIVSIIFVAQAAGFLGAAFVNHTLKSKFGQAKTYVFSEVLMMIAFAIIAATAPYPAVVFAFFLSGWAMAINLTLNNIFCGSLAGSTVILGAAQGAYGVGGTIGPFIATAMVSNGILWSRYYLITLVICTICACATGWSFWDIEKEPSHQLHLALEQTASRRATDAAKGRILVRALRNITTPIGALFTFAYQGAEVSISGWVISFLISERSGDPAKVGYVTAGFWGGITLGRFILAPLSARYNQKYVIHALGASAIAFQLLVWLIPNIVGDSVAVALVGFVLGPIAPCSMAYFMRLLPVSIQTTSISFISSAGSSGGAAAPFITGLLAQSKGTWVLHPVCIALFMVMGACWFALPSVEKRRE